MIPNMTPYNQLLPQLLKGSIGAIEYGDPKAPGGIMSLLRIRLVQTMAGPQLAIKHLHYGAEGSGIYFPITPNGVQELRDHLIAYVDRYHNKPLPTRLSDLLKRRMKERYEPLTFFALNKED